MWRRESWQNERGVRTNRDRKLFAQHAVYLRQPSAALHRRSLSATSRIFMKKLHIDWVARDTGSFSMNLAAMLVE
jgi:hypothetical protein